MAVLPANFSDEYGAKVVLRQMPFQIRWALFILDGGYDKPPLIHWCETVFDVIVTISRRLTNKGFQVIPKRWIVERTFAWLGTWRRLSKDYETSPLVSQNLLYVAMIHLMLRRLHP